MKKAIILLSGGLDSTTVLAIAKSKNYQCFCLSFDYNQRHKSELESARNIASLMQVEHKQVNIDLRSIGGSSLTDSDINVPDYQAGDEHKISVNYVPARNITFMSIALGWAETIGAYDIFIGANKADYESYPDCRDQFIRSFEQMANVSTKSGVEGKKFKIHAPLLNMTKDEIIATGIKLNVDYSKTVSCYNADKNGLSCGSCVSCTLRKQGFQRAKIEDPTKYIASI
jgi:7-cyano-7-deazaguanine synthase